MSWCSEADKHSYLHSSYPFKIFAHRGLCFRQGKLQLDENTIPAFLNAIELGIEYIELDVQSTLDKKAIVFHDAVVDRVSESTGSVSDYSLAALREIQLSFGGRISTMEEVIAALPSACKINIDLKSSAALSDLASLINRLKLHERVLITSFSETRRKAALLAIPGVATSPSAWLVFKIWLRIFLGLKPGRLLKLVNVLQIPVSYGPIRFDSPKFIESVKRHGVELVYWTINDPAEAKRLRQIGASGVVTDRSDLMTAAFASE